jgi:hypothetical protein
MLRILTAVLALSLAACGNISSSSDMGAKKAFGDNCTADTDCESGICRGFQMMTVTKCTKACTAATAAQDCPNPPSTGTCNTDNICKF